MSTDPDRKFVHVTYYINEKYHDCVGMVLMDAAKAIRILTSEGHEWFFRKEDVRIREASEAEFGDACQGI